MDFTFSEDQIAFRDTMHSFFAKELPVENIRKLWENESSDVAGQREELLGKIAEQGLMGLSIPEDFGGLGLTDMDWVLMHQELGYYAVTDDVVDTAYVAVGLLSSLPDDCAAKAEWLGKIAEGSARVAVGHPANRFVAHADRADLLLLWHNDEVHAVPAAQVQVSVNQSVDLGRRLGRVTWTPSEATRVADATLGKTLWEQALNRGALAAAAQLLGLAQRMVDISIAYTAERKQFGKAIGTFQAVKHHLANVAVKTEFARPVLERAAFAVTAGSGLASEFVSHAKIVCAEAAVTAARNGMQVHGAMGYTWEVDLQIFMKRSWALDAAWGDRATHKNRIAARYLSAGAPLGAGNTFI